MSVTEMQSPRERVHARREAAPPDPATHATPRRRFQSLPLLITLLTLALAAVLGRAMWNAYMRAPWTRDGTVRAYVVTIAPEVDGRIVALPLADNQRVHRGDLLMVIDPTNFTIAVRLAEAALKQAKVNAENAARESRRRQMLTDLAVSPEVQQTYATAAISAQAQYQQAAANLDQARVNLERTQIRSPVDGWVTNLTAQLGDYAHAGQSQISLVDSNSFWIDAYFDETSLGAVHQGDHVKMKLMGYSDAIPGHVASVARGINVANAQPNQQGLATVNPIFTWVRLAQRVPVRIEIERLPQDVVLVAGLTATVEIEPRTQPPAR